MDFIKYDYVIPSHYLPVLINGDPSGLSDDEVLELDAFIADLPDFGHWDCEDESYFSHTNDVNNLGGDVTDCAYLVVVELSDVAISYLETALWSSTDDDGNPLDDTYGVEDIAPETKQEAQQQLNDFFEYINELFLLNEARKYRDDNHIAHDFWLTRNGHGAGFWDGAYGDIGDQLTAAAKSFGSVDLYVGDDNQIWA